MIERYNVPEIAAIWTDEAKFNTWLKVELAALKAWVEVGEAPAEAYENCRRKARFDVARVKEIEKTTNHDVIAFLTNVAEYVGPDSRYIHLGMTSSDLVDTALALQLKQAVAVIEKHLVAVLAALKKQALAHRLTPVMGRTHGVHAEPTTFGLKMLLYYTEFERHQERLKELKKRLLVGKISGAVGTFANFPPHLEERVMKGLGLKPAPVSTQIVQRDRHAEFLNWIALVGSSLDKLAIEIRHLQRTELREAEEYFSPGQKGSSAMPHKRNPITAERISGMARLLRGYALVGLENVPLWHERDISHSSAERMALPDATGVLVYILKKAAWLVDTLLVYPGRMKENLELTGGLFYSQVVLLALVQSGQSREAAYGLVQENAMQSWASRTPLKTLLLQDARVVKALSKKRLNECFDPARYLKHVDEIYARAGLK